MTQKELLYVEDAVDHENVIIDILNNMLECISDNELITFSKKELKKHINYKEKLLNYIKEESCE